MRIEMIFAG